jgi:hypothetical protein
VNAETKNMHYSNTVESLVAALESKLGDDDKDYSKKDKRKFRE